ncbi:hypothetical protein [Spirillospora sp. NPDC048819]|uniref:hypothetical protein n=1 Tax=Spirillospora sp. NPDC048819 TaxID=3155268 RepID=UPI003406D49D
MTSRPRARAATLGDSDLLARVHGAFNVASGTWPLAGMRSFGWIFGPKQDIKRDKWLVRTVAGLLVSAAWSQLRAGSSPEGRAHARRTGLGTALTLLTIDLVYVPRGRLRWTHLLDASMEAAWIAAWLRARTDPAGD